MHILFPNLIVSDVMSPPIAILSAVLKRAGHTTVGINILQIPENFHELILFHKPDLLAISSMSAHWHLAKVVIEMAKEALPELPVIVGGYHATLDPEEVISHPGVDALCIGEGEAPLLEYIEGLEGKREITTIKNLWVKKEGQIFKNPIRDLNPDLDSLPYFDWDVIDFNYLNQSSNLSIMRQYYPDKKGITIVTSRGCPYRCTYCSNRNLMDMYKGHGKFIRRMSVDRVLEEIRYYKTKYEFDFIDIGDEQFVLDQNWLEEFCEKYGSEFGYEFVIFIRPETCTEENLRMMKKAGLKAIAIGVESGSEKYRKEYLNRHMSNDLLVEVANRAHRLEIDLIAFCMIGMPLETPEDLRATIDLNQKMKPEILTWFHYQPFPFTKLFDIAVENDLLIRKEVRVYHSQSRALKHKFLTQQQLNQAAAYLQKIKWQYSKIKQDQTIKMNEEHWRKLNILFHEKYRKQVSDYLETNPHKWSVNDNYKIVAMDDESLKKVMRLFPSHIYYYLLMEYWEWAVESHPSGKFVNTALTGNGRVLGALTGMGRPLTRKGENFCSLVINQMVLFLLEKQQKIDPDLNRNLLLDFRKRFSDKIKFLTGVFPTEQADALELYFGEKIMKFDSVQIHTLDLSIKDKFSPSKWLQKKFEKINYKVEQVTEFTSENDNSRNTDVATTSPNYTREYLNWKYLRVPKLEYFKTRLTDKNGNLLGHAVIQINFLNEGTATLIDWHVKDYSLQLYRYYLRHIISSMRLAGQKTLTIWSLEKTVIKDILADFGFVSKTNPAKLCFIPVDEKWRDIIPEMVHDWHFNFGDTDDLDIAKVFEK